MDKLFENIKKNYKQVKDELAPAKGKCPDEEVLWQYAKGMAKENEQTEGHLLSCPACLEMVRVIKTIYNAEGSRPEVPEHIHRRAKEILQGELKRPVPHSRERTEAKARIAILWDKVHNKIIQINSEFGEILGLPIQELEPVRKIPGGVADQQKPLHSNWKIEIPEGVIFLDIRRSVKEGYISIKTSLKPKKDIPLGNMEDMRAVVYKADRLISSLYFDKKGEVLIDKLQEGEYSLTILAGQRSLGSLEFFLQRVEEKVEE